MSGNCDDYVNIEKVVLGSAKAMMLEDTVFKNQRGWMPKYADSEEQFLPIFLKQLSAMHYLEGTDKHGKKLYEVSLNNLRAYHIRGKTWHELTQQDGSLIALQFTDDREFDSFYLLLQGLLLGLNKLKATPTGRQDDSLIYDELVIFHVQQLKLNTLERTRPSPAERSVGPPLPPRQSQKQAVLSTADELVGQWRCVDCTLQNQANDFFCKACDKMRNDAWQCITCHRIHVLDVSLCSVCGVVRCNHCTSQNKPGTMSCPICF